MVHVPSRMEGSLSFGQYIRSIRMNLPAGAGSQLLSFSGPGLSFWMYRSVEPSGLAFRFCRGLIEYRLIGLATKKYWASYIVIDQKPSAGGVWPFSKWMTYLFDPSYSLSSASLSEVGYTASCGRFAPSPIAVTSARVR